MDPLACLLRSDSRAAFQDMRAWLRLGGWKPTYDHMTATGMARARILKLIRLGFVHRF